MGHVVACSSLCRFCSFLIQTTLQLIPYGLTLIIRWGQGMCSFLCSCTSRLVSYSRLRRLVPPSKSVSFSIRPYSYSMFKLLIRLTTSPVRRQSLNPTLGASYAHKTPRPIGGGRIPTWHSRLASFLPTYQGRPLSGLNEACSNTSN